MAVEKEKEAVALCAEAEAQIKQNDWEAACESARAAVAKYKALGHFRGVAEATRLVVQAYLLEVEALRFEAHFGSQKNACDTLKKAEGICRKELEYFREKGNKYGEASMMWTLAALNTTGPRKDKIDLASQACTMCKDLQDPAMEAQALMTLSTLHVGDANAQEAVDCASESVRLCRDGDDTVALVKALRCLAEARWSKKEGNAAVEVLLEALITSRRTGDTKLEVALLEKIASWQLAQERPRDALEPVREALAMLEEAEAGDSTANAIKIIVEACLKLGELDVALREASAGLARAKERKDWRGETKMHCLMAKVHLARAEVEDAVKQADLAYVATGELYDKDTTASVLQTCFEVFYGIGYLEHALFCQEEVAKMKLEQSDGVGELAALASQLHIVNKMGGRDQLKKQIEARIKSLRKDLPHDSSLGEVLLQLAKEDSDALGTANEALGYFKMANDAPNEAEAWAVMAELHTKLGQKKDAVEAAAKSRKLWQNCDRRMKAANSYRLEAEMLLNSDDLVGSMKTASQGILACRVAEDAACEVKCAVLLMRAAVLRMRKNKETLEKKQVDTVLRAGKDAQRVARKLQDIHLPYALFWTANVLFTATQDEKETMELAKEALTYFDELKNLPGQAGSHLMLASCYDVMGQQKEAQTSAQKALELFQEAERMDGISEALMFLRKYGAVSTGPAVAAPMPAVTAAPAAPAASETAVEPSKKRLAAEDVRTAILGMANDVMTESEISGDFPLMDAGLDSLAAVQFRNDLATKFEVTLPASLIFDYPNVNEIAGYVHALADQ